MKDYLAVLEPAEDGSWSAYVPDLPGCTSSGLTRDDVTRNLRVAVKLYIDEVRSEGMTVPDPVSLPAMVHVSP